MAISDRPLALLKAKESSATTLLVGTTSLWMLSLGSAMALAHDTTKSNGGVMYKLGLTPYTSSQSTIVVCASRYAFVPRTALGKTLAALREAAIARGLPLLTADEISNEIARRRGETV